MRRLQPIETGSLHHIYSKSIYQFVIFTCPLEYERIHQLMHYYQYDGHPIRFSEYLQRNNVKQKGLYTMLQEQQHTLIKLVNIIAFCFMPTHVHFVIEELSSKGIQTFMERSLNAYTRYFNLRHNRRGPLWEHRFGNTLITSEEHLQKAIEYVETNPVKDKLVKHPSQWQYSSYHLHPGGEGGSTI